jgi:hypothetical protein
MIKGARDVDWNDEHDICNRWLQKCHEVNGGTDSTTWWIDVNEHIICRQLRKWQATCVVQKNTSSVQ